MTKGKPTVEECAQVIEGMVAKINEMEDNHQLIPPVAKALRQELGVSPKNPKENFEIKVVRATQAKPVEIGKKATKKTVISALNLANKFISNLKIEIDDVKKAAKHYLGFEGTNAYSVGYLFVLAASAFAKPETDALKLYKKHLGQVVARERNYEAKAIEEELREAYETYRAPWRQRGGPEAPKVIDYDFSGYDAVYERWVGYAEEKGDLAIAIRERADSS